VNRRRRRLLILLLVVAAGAVVVGAWAAGSRQTPAVVPAATGEVTAELVRDSSHRLSTAETGDVTLVEFLDFECEACAAYFPVLEQLRQVYGDRVTFVIRYFPLPSHVNSLNAAAAVEAAARQGRFVDMYRAMFETQPQWGERQHSQAAYFRSLAEQMGLDMQAFDRDFSDPATLERIAEDYRDGVALGVSSTPTFFLDGQRIQPASAEEFSDLIEEALRRADG
jgi:protein-disulfide isomerase